MFAASWVECGHARGLVTESGQLRAPPHRIDETHEERIVERHAVAIAAFEHADRDQRRRIADGQRPKDQRIDQRERDRAAPNRQRKRGDCGQRDGQVATQHPDREAHVAQHGVEAGDELYVPAALANHGGVPKPAPGFPVGFVGSQTVGHQVAGPGVDVELQFFVQLVGHPLLAKHVDDA